MYRDDLAAAQARIEQLERENAELKVWCCEGCPVVGEAHCLRLANIMQPSRWARFKEVVLTALCGAKESS